MKLYMFIFYPCQCSWRDLSVRPFVCLPATFCGFHTFLDKLLTGLISNLVDNSLWDSAYLINFWSCSTGHAHAPMLQQFPCICRQTTDQIRLKVDGQMHYEPPQTWVIFVRAPLSFHKFLASDWLSSFYAFGDKSLIWLSSNLEGELCDLLPQSDLLTFGPAPLNSCHFLMANIWDILVPLLLPMSLSLVRAQSFLGREAIS